MKSTQENVQLSEMAAARVSPGHSAGLRPEKSPAEESPTTIQSLRVLQKLGHVWFGGRGPSGQSKYELRLDTVAKETVKAPVMGPPPATDPLWLRIFENGRPQPVVTAILGAGTSTMLITRLMRAMEVAFGRAPTFAPPERDEPRSSRPAPEYEQRTPGVPRGRVAP